MAVLLNYSCEVLDKRGRTLCILPREEISSQKLRHHAVGALIRDPRGRMLLAGNALEGYGLSSLAPLPAGMASEDFCSMLVKRDWLPGVARLFLIDRLLPRAETANALLNVFEARVSCASADDLAQTRENSLLADLTEAKSLLRHDGLISPALALILPKLVERPPER